MPLIPIPDDQLNELCIYLTQQSYIYYQVQQDFLNDLYNTGCRPKELLQPSRWTFYNSADIQLQPLKGNSTRYFIEEELSAELVFAIMHQVEPYQGLSLRQLTSVTKRILPVPEVRTIEKSAIDYIFRYNYVKQLHLSGMSDADIALKMGWHSPLLALSYYSRTVFSTMPIPPLDTNYLTDLSGNILTDQFNNQLTY